MKYQLFFLILMILIPPTHAEQLSSTYYLIRHAEKDLNIKTDPPLTDQGRARSHQWAEVLSQVKLDYVYSTDTLRTRDTALAVANSQNLELSIYSAKDLNYQEFAKKHVGHSVLIVGHSNTSPAFTNGLLGAEKYPNLDESVYGNLYIVEIMGKSRNAKILTYNPPLP